jgi:transposase
MIQKAALIYEDEVSFRQDSTLHQTWARKGNPPIVPVTGQRKSVKIFGCVEIYSGRFLYHQDTVFNAATYLAFLEQVARRYYPRSVLYIQDNASYHKDQDVWAWFSDNRTWWTTFNLPPYSPDLNAAEPLWHYTRVSGTHNRYFLTADQLAMTVKRIFRQIQRCPQLIMGYLSPFI